MAAFVITFISAFCAYLWLSIGSGAVLGLWAGAEVAIGLVASVAVAFVCAPLFSRVVKLNALNPKRWLSMVVYACGPFFVELTWANLTVAKAVITGRIRPGILRVRTGMRSDAALTLLANSITLTPGTLSVEVEPETNDLFVHMLEVPPELEAREFLTPEDLFSHCDCAAWVRRIAEDAPPPEEPA